MTHSITYSFFLSDITNIDIERIRSNFVRSILKLSGPLDVSQCNLDIEKIPLLLLSTCLPGIRLFESTKQKDRIA
jgi:hypothetical protein